MQDPRASLTLDARATLRELCARMCLSPLQLAVVGEMNRSWFAPLFSVALLYVHDARHHRSVLNRNISSHHSVGTRSLRRGWCVTPLTLLADIECGTCSASTLVGRPRPPNYKKFEGSRGRCTRCAGLKRKLKLTLTLASAGCSPRACCRTTLSSSLSSNERSARRARRLLHTSVSSRSRYVSARHSPFAMLLPAHVLCVLPRAC